ncbi:hypothetical protein M427DRAFT_67831 [Gonapodya prolifera JEL478]|uniref:Uncharacterized protein n=1 Tax=Gonapodya prolifera (strain JEL478) TaxID=1344416 RepID=A0A139ANV2_GONPJ|nr:hypothetical protein M427DRAFT_67831 [Gonapodya prolifera JEL478]|eukprot:KXS18416.1 hypothetical protein M427DRAFT_67831 [Gonapodya prolifera JEL478]
MSSGLPAIEMRPADEHQMMAEAARKQRRHSRNRTTSNFAPNSRPRTPLGSFVGDAMGEPLTALALQTPAPSSYSPTLPPLGPFFSILGKRKDDPVEGPGPKYDTRAAAESSGIVERPPKWTIAGRHALPSGLGEELGLGALTTIGDGRCSDVERASTPGPGSYSRNVPFGSDAPAVSIMYKHEDPPNDNPGPATYFPKLAVGPTPKFTFGARTREPTDARPGPTDYSPPRTPPTAPQPPSYTMADRAGPALFDNIVQYHASVPAANAYYPKLLQKGTGVTLKGRSEGPNSLFSAPKAMQGIPAPGHYNPPTPHSSPSVSLAPKYLEDTLHPPLPAPTAYAPNFYAASTLPKPPRYSLGIRRGTQMGLPANTDPADVPAPGSYSYDVRVIKKSVPKISIKGKWKVRVDATPGPGAYGTVPPKWQDELAAMREERRRRAKEAKERAAVGGAQAAAEREKEEGETDGQAQENTESGEGSSRAESIVGEMKKQDVGYRELQINEIREETPGPAAYVPATPPSKTGASPAFTLGGRLENTGMFAHKSDTPSPNAYDPLTAQAALSNVAGSPTVTLKGRPSPYRIVNSRQLKVADVGA